MRIANPAERSDDELVAAIRRGDVDAYGELWVRYERPALALARRLTRNGADDIVAEAFARILRVVRSGKGPDSNFHAYLSTTIRSLIIDASRVKSSGVVPIGDQTVLAYLSGSVPGPDELVAGGAGADADLAAAAWGSLSERDRSIMWATAVEGYSTAEVAEQMGVSTSKAAVWVHRARERIRDAFLAHHAPTTGYTACDRQRRRLRGYLRGKLSDADDRDLSSHLDHCPGCAEAFAAARTVNERIRGEIVAVLPATSFPSPRHRRTVNRLLVRPSTSTTMAAKIAITSLMLTAVSGLAIVTIPNTPRQPEATAPASRSPERVPATGQQLPARSPVASPSPRRHTLQPPRANGLASPARTHAPRSPTAALGSIARPSLAPSVVPPPPVPPVPNLLEPSGFETVAVPDGGDVVYPAGATIAGWTVVGDSIDVAGSAQLPPPDGDPTGTRVVDLIGNNRNAASRPDGIERVVATDPGARYRVSFALAGNPWNDQGIKTGEMRVDGIVQLKFSVDTTGRSTASSASMGWMTKTVEFVAAARKTTISFIATNGRTPAGPVITDVTMYRITQP